MQNLRCCTDRLNPPSVADIGDVQIRRVANKMKIKGVGDNYSVAEKYDVADPLIALGPMITMRICPTNAPAEAVLVHLA